MEYSGDFKHQHVKLSEIIGTDQDIEELDASVKHLALALPNLLNSKIQRDVLRLAYSRAPVILVERSKGYVSIGNPLNLHVARSLYDKDEQLPALICTKSRLSKFEKLQILAADLLIPHILYRSRHGLPKTLFTFCQRLNEQGASPLKEFSAKAFNEATGFSVK